MILSEHHPRDLEGLLSNVRAAIGSAARVVVQAGHFLVYYDTTEDLLLPCIESELTGPRHQAIREEIGKFPFLTWTLALRLLESLDAEAEKSIMVLVNDWQYVPEGVERSRFFQRHSRLPAVYEEARAHSTANVVLMRPRSGAEPARTGDFFSEKDLRNAYRRRLKGLLASKSLPPNVDVVWEGREAVCSLTDTLGYRQEIYCAGKSPNCTHEVAELLAQVDETSRYDVFVNFFPEACNSFVEAGTELCFELFRPAHLRRVINVGLPATGVHDWKDLATSMRATVHGVREVR